MPAPSLASAPMSAATLSVWAGPAELAREADIERAALRPVEEKERLAVAELVAEGDRRISGS